MAATMLLSQQHSCSFDYLVGERNELIWDLQTENPRGLVVDDKLELRRLHDRQLGGLRAFEDAARVNAGLTKSVRHVGAIAHQPADFGIFTPGIDRRQP